MENRKGVAGRVLSETYFSVVESRESSCLSEYWDSASVCDGAVNLGVMSFAVAGSGSLAGNMNPKEETSPPVEAIVDVPLPESHAGEPEAVVKPSGEGESICPAPSAVDKPEGELKPSLEDETTGTAPVVEETTDKPEEQAKRSRNSFSKKVSKLFSSFSKKGETAQAVEKMGDSVKEVNPTVKEEQSFGMVSEGIKPELVEAKGEASLQKEVAESGEDDIDATDDVIPGVSLEGTGIKAETKEMAPSPLEVHASCDKPTPEEEPMRTTEAPLEDDIPTSDSMKKSSLDEGLFFNSPAAIAAALAPAADAAIDSSANAQTHAQSGGGGATGGTSTTGNSKRNDPKKSGSFLENIFNFGSRNSSRKEEAAPMTEEGGDDAVEVGYGLTKRNILKLSERLDAALKEEGKSMASIFNRSFDEFNDPVEYFLEMEASFSVDETAPGIIESLSLELGDEHPLVTELKRKHNLGQIEQVDAYVRDSLEKEEKGLSESIFKEKPEEYKTTAEYYSSLEKKASDMGHSLLPSLTDKLGENHPIVKVLSEAKPPPSEKIAEDLKDEFSDVELTQTSTQELPVSEGGVLHGMEIGTNRGSGKEGSMIVRDETDTPGGFCGGCICLRA